MVLTAQIDLTLEAFNPGLDAVALRIDSIWKWSQNQVNTGMVIMTWSLSTAAASLLGGLGLRLLSFAYILCTICSDAASCRLRSPSLSRADCAMLI